MRPLDFDVNKLIEDLKGTATSIENHLPDEMTWEDLTEEDHDKIDQEIFLCEQCGWWCENSEQHEGEENGLCDDCFGEEE